MLAGGDLEEVPAGFIPLPRTKGGPRPVELFPSGNAARAPRRGGGLARMAMAQGVARVSLLSVVTRADQTRHTVKSSPILTPCLAIGKIFEPP